MPSSAISTTIFRSISIPSNLLSPFIHPNKNPSQFLHKSLHKTSNATFRRISPPTSTITFAMYKRRAERSIGENRPAKICSSRSSLSDGGVAEEKRDEKVRQERGVFSSRLLTLPTVLTLGRVAAVPILVSTYHVNGSWATTTTTGVFLVAAFTDWLDGYLARKMQLGTTFGAFLDPVADKLMVAATLILLCSKPLEVAFFGVVPWILTVPTIAIIGREITMSAVREWAASQNSGVLEAVAVNKLGKWKTATQMTALTILLLNRDPSFTGPGFLVSTGVFLVYVSAGLALWSLAVYMRKIWRFLIK